MVYFYGTKPEERRFIKYQKQRCKCSNGVTTKYTWLNVFFFCHLRERENQRDIYVLCLFSRGDMNWNNLFQWPVHACLKRLMERRRGTIWHDDWRKTICGLYKQMNEVIHSQCKCLQYQNVVLSTKQLSCICKMFFMPSNWWTQIINLAVWN